ncbi:MAG: glycosyltransferase family 4 protein [Paludibacter sp.]|nr:glycosyltransferase family 4 protein [Paludibacter sp.]
MRVLIVCSKNSGHIAPFITDQAEALKREEVEIDFYTVEGKGLIGYLKNFRLLKKKVKAFKPDIIHAHYGLSGLLANLQRKIPVVTTYHGSDINDDNVFRLSKIAIKLSAANIFVSEKNLRKAHLTPGPSPQGEGNRKKSKSSLIPCGVDIDLFKPIDKTEARKELKLEASKKYVLFAGAFHNKVKNPELAIKSVSQLEGVELLELKGYTREQVALLMNAVDVVLMTSFSEGSPQFIKEAMACNCPVVSVPVGDVPEVIQDVDGCYLAGYDINEISEKLQLLLDKTERTNGRDRIVERGLDAETVAKKIVEIYEIVGSW